MKEFVRKARGPQYVHCRLKLHLRTTSHIIECPRIVVSLHFINKMFERNKAELNVQNSIHLNIINVHL